MAHYPKKTIFSPSPGLESPKPEQRSIFSQSPSLPRPQSTFLPNLLNLTNSPLPEGVPRISSSKLLSNNPSLMPRVVTMSREALDTLTETARPRNRSPFYRVELLEKKNMLLEEENMKLLEINEKTIEKEKFEEKIKELERKNRNNQEENLNLIKEINNKKSEINNLEKLIKTHQEQHNSLISGQNKENDDLREKYMKLQTSLSEEIAQKSQIEQKYEDLIKVHKENNEELREENNKLLQNFKEITIKYEDQVQRNQESDQYYSRTMLEYKAEIASIRSQYDMKIQSLTISKDKFNEFVNASRYELDHLRKLLKEKTEEIDKLNNLLAQAPVQTDSSGNTYPNEYFNHPSKRLFNNIDDFGEKISNLLQENEKLNEKVMINEMESAQWRTKFHALEEKIKNLNNTTTHYCNSEVDFNDEEATLKEKSLNAIKTTPKTMYSKRNPSTVEGKRPSYKISGRNIKNADLKNNNTSSKENIENHWQNQVKVLRNTSGGVGLRNCKIERNLSYSIKKNY